MKCEETIFPLIFDEIDTSITNTPRVSNIAKLKVKNKNIPDLEAYADFVEGLNSKYLDRLDQR